LKAHPEPFQKEGVRIIEQHGRGLIADEMGLGKTYQSLLIARRNPSWLPQVVVCPAIVKWNWEKEALEKVGLRASVCEGQTPPELKSGIWRGGDSPLFIINYEILKYWVPYFRQIGIKSLVLDECQNVTNRLAQRTKAARTLAKGCEHVLGLSGTPMTNRPAEMFSILNMIWPDEFSQFWDFANRYCRPRITPWGWDFSGAANIDELNERLLKLGMVRRKLAEVKSEMPAIRRSVVLCDLIDEREYRRAYDDVVAFVKGKDPHLYRAAKQGGGFFRVGYLMRLAAKLKMRAVCSWVNNFLENTDRKIVLFTVHRGAAEVLEKRINGQSVVINGGVSHKDRKMRIAQFTRDPKVRVTVASMRACATGLDGLQRAASDAAFVEIGPTPAIHRQAEARLDRMGQTMPVSSSYLVGRGTIEQQACLMLQRKQDISSHVLDGRNVKNELDIHRELIRLVDREKYHGSSIEA